MNQSGNTSNAYVDSNARIIAVENFTLAASSNNKASASGEAYAAGGIGVAQGNGTTTIDYTTSASLNQDADVLAGGFANVSANTTVNGSATGYGDGKGFGADGHADGTTTIGTSASSPATTTATLGTGRVTDRDADARRRDGVVGRGKRVGQGLRCRLLRRRLRQRDRELLGDEHRHPLRTARRSPATRAST